MRLPWHKPSNLPGQRSRIQRPPEGLGKNAVPDQRFPLTYQAPVTNGTRILMDHLAALSRRDINGVADTMHFPFASYEGTDLYVAKTREEFVAKPPASLNMTMNPEAAQSQRRLPEAGQL